ncbi:Ldh family oxidoreductase [Paenibacillus sp. GCM10023248]|uniref:Ldh family oxidoreductase n=1 Tax=unclassified Paenibacillus TaxID=185978 RepID=UPI0023781847|nr:Ldh family oxidoreductase [Paenibacillus sp. MAHUQ-63]MDD9269378.1 Ldh family oxidoreductase [Paenibacillus sp. MAHUQ-63]
MSLPLTYDWEKLQSFCRDVFIRAGVPEGRASIVSESLIQADLRGVESHGVVRTGIYLKRVEKGMMDPQAEPEIVSEHGSTALIDGRNNFGSVVGSYALDIAMARAKQYGAAIVGVKGSNHFGTGAYYAQKAIEQDLILLVMSNASQTMPPTGGVRPFIGTNPLCIGVPAGEENPFILDMATSVVARGKIIMAAQKGEAIPLGWAIDKEGRPTTDAEAALEGSVLPVGGPKGYAISMFIDILSGVLTGAGYGQYVNNMYENWDEPQNVGHFFIAVDISRFLPLELFKQRVDLYIRQIKSEPKAPGVTEIMVPGDMERRQTEARKREGILLPPKVAAELNEIGMKYGLRLDEAALLNLPVGEGAAD